MRRPTRAVLAFVVTSLAAVNLSALASPGYRPAPVVSPPTLTEPTPAPARPAHRVERIDVTVPLDDGARTGWLFRPADTLGTAALVLVPGAGPHGRDDLTHEATALAAAGVTAVVTDKRTAGYGVLRRDLHRLADDAVGTARWLARQPGVDARRIGVMGWSEGGWVAPMAADLDPVAIRQVVLVSAPVVTPIEQMGHLVERYAAATPTWLRRLAVTTLAGGAAVDPSLGTDIRTDLGTLRQPVYAVWGSADEQVPVVEAVRRLTAATPSAEVRVVPGLGHGMDPSGGWLADVAAWTDAPAAHAGERRGTAPDDHTGVPAVPPYRWFLHPALHLGVSLAVAALAAALPRRRRTDPIPTRPTRSVTA